MQNNPQTTCTSTSGSLATVSEAGVITTAASSTPNPNTETTEYNNCSKKLKSYQDHTSINELI